MTKNEKIIIISLTFILITGITIRALRAYHSRINFEVVHSEELSSQKEKFETVRLKAMTVDLNQAQAKDFEKLAGIGPKLAQRIIEVRNKGKRFTKPQEILEVKGFGKDRYEKLKPYLLVDGLSDPLILPNPENSHPTKNSVDLNNASVQELESLPFIGKTLAEKIVLHRENYGLFKEKNELLLVKGISVTLYKKIESYLTVR